MRLNHGQFLGVDLAGLIAKAFVVRVTRYVPGAQLSMHDHRNPNLCLILHGGFDDLAVGWGRAGAGDAVMHPGGMGHSQRFADGGSLAVNVEIDADRTSKRMTSAGGGRRRPRKEVRRGAPIRQVGPQGRRRLLRAGWRAERGALGRWLVRFGNERAYSPALLAGESRARRRGGGAGGSGEVELFA